MLVLHRTCSTCRRCTTLHAFVLVVYPYSRVRGPVLYHCTKQQKPECYYRCDRGVRLDLVSSYACMVSHLRSVSQQSASMLLLRHAT